MDTLMKIRNLDDYPCSGAYSYSDKIAMPTLENTDYLFLKSATDLNAADLRRECFPNPFDKTITMSRNSEKALYEMSDIRGVLVWKGNCIEQHDFSALAKGIYIVRMREEGLAKTCTFIK